MRKLSQLETKIKSETHWSKRSKETGQFMDQKEKENSRASGGSGDLAHPGNGRAMTAFRVR